MWGATACRDSHPITRVGLAPRPLAPRPSQDKQSREVQRPEEGAEGKATRKELGTQGRWREAGGPGVQPGQGPPNQRGLGRGARGRTSPAAGSALGQDVQVDQGQRLEPVGLTSGLAEAAEQPLPPPDLPAPRASVCWAVGWGHGRACLQGDHGAQTVPGTGGAVHLGLLLWTLSRGPCGWRGRGHRPSQPTHPRPAGSQPRAQPPPRQVPPGPDPPGTPGVAS